MVQIICTYRLSVPAEVNSNNTSRSSVLKYVAYMGYLALSVQERTDRVRTSG
jgi:hypothetical protein